MSKPKQAEAEKLEWWDIEKVKPDPRNTRTHPQSQIDAVAESMRQFGWTFPCLIQPDGTLIAGEGRWRAAQQAGYTKCKVLIAEGWSKNQIRAYIIADNQLPELAGWDTEKLRTEIAALTGDGFPTLTLGFSAEELQAILNPGSGADGANTGVAGSLAASFGIAPFTVFSARDGWWQDRKRAWLALGIKSEVGRGEGVTGGATPDGIRPLDRQRNARIRAQKASPGGSAMPAADYSKSKARGNGAGKAMRKPAPAP